METIWFRDPAAFLAPRALGDVLPVAGAPLEQQLNAVLRFSVYYAAIVAVYRQSADALVLPLLVAGATYLVHEARQPPGEGFADDARLARRRCTPPTRNNPFMNVLADELGKPKAEACDALDRGVADDVRALFRKKTFVDQDDVYGRNDGSRQFYTTPVTSTVNDQRGFAHWLYGELLCNRKKMPDPPPPVPGTAR